MMKKQEMIEILDRIHQITWNQPEGTTAYVWARMGITLGHEDIEVARACPELRDLSTKTLDEIAGLLKGYERGKGRGLPVISWPPKFLKPACVQVLDCIHDLIQLQGTGEDPATLMQGVLDAIHPYRDYVREKGTKAYHFDGYGDLVRGRNQYTKGIKGREYYHKQWERQLRGSGRRRRF